MWGDFFLIQSRTNNLAIFVCESISLCSQVGVARSEGGVEREGVPGRGSCSSSCPEGQTTWPSLCVNLSLCSQVGVARSEGEVGREVPGRGSCSSSGPEGQTAWPSLCVNLSLCSQVSVARSEGRM